MCRRRSSEERLTKDPKLNRRRRKVSSGEQLADCRSDGGGGRIVLSASCRHRVRIMAGLDLMDQPKGDVIRSCVRAPGQAFFIEAFSFAAVLKAFLVVGGCDQRGEPVTVGG